MLAPEQQVTSPVQDIHQTARVLSASMHFDGGGQCPPLSHQLLHATTKYHAVLGIVPSHNKGSTTTSPPTHNHVLTFH